MEQGLATGRDVAAMIIEPIQSEGGDHHASPYFFQQLQKICKEVGHKRMLLGYGNQSLAVKAASLGPALASIKDAVCIEIIVCTLHTLSCCNWCRPK